MMVFVFLQVGFLPGSIWVFPKTGVPQNGWFIVENPIERDDLGGKPAIFHIKIWFLKLCFLRKVHWWFLLHPKKKKTKVLHCIPR